ncbi:MAG: hypothetical protein R2857_01215 [Vampirovibrionales bacterium]
MTVITPEYAWVTEDKGGHQDFNVFSTTKDLGTQIDGFEHDPGMVSSTASQQFKGVVSQGKNATHFKMDLNGDGQIDDKTEHVSVDTFIVKGDDPWASAENDRLGKPIDEANVKFGVNTSKGSSST